MHQIKAYNFIFSFVAIALFSLPTMVDFSGYSSNQVIDFFSNDFEDASEAMEDISNESKIKEFNVGHQDRMLLNSTYFRDSIEFGQIETDHSLEVFYEVVTPPPEVEGLNFRNIFDS